MSWPPAPNSPTLSSHEVHVYLFDLTADVTPYRAYLSDDEHIRAERYRIPRVRDRFIVSRGVLRDILARYTGLVPQTHQFLYGTHGKPSLHPDQNRTDLHFNLSHSQDFALLVVTQGRAVGVDIEHIHRVSDANGIAARFFSADEYAVYRDLPDEMKETAFFNCWTRKEAYTKALGASYPLIYAQFVVTLRPGDCPRLLHTAVEADTVSNWTFLDLPPVDGFAASLAVAGTEAVLYCWHYESKRV